MPHGLMHLFSKRDARSSSLDNRRWLWHEDQVVVEASTSQWFQTVPVSGYSVGRKELVEASP